jgi:hypothetical protein
MSYGQPKKQERKMKHPIAALMLSVSLLLTPAGVILAANPHSSGSTGQPNQSCGSSTAPNTPGHASTAPGSAFNPSGKAGTVYAGEQPQNSNNPRSVSQYDCACFQVSQPH